VHQAGGLFDGIGHVDVRANLAGVEIDDVDDEAVKAVKSGFRGVRELEIHEGAARYRRPFG
jgi:hypothetical protein